MATFLITVIHTIIFTLLIKAEQQPLYSTAKGCEKSASVPLQLIYLALIYMYVHSNYGHNCVF